MTKHYLEENYGMDNFCSTFVFYIKEAQLRSKIEKSEKDN
jgi:hypothetical protein